MRLNRTLIDQLERPETGELVITDDEVPNFGVRVMPSGIKTYFVRYRVGGGRRAKMRRITIGRSSIFTPEKARQAAKDILAQARLGEDPAAVNAKRREAITVSALLDEWMAGPGKRNRTGELRSEQSFTFEKARLENHVRPVLGSIKLPDLRKADIERLRDQIASGSTAKKVKTKRRGVARVRGGEGAATRTLRILSVVCAYGVERGHMSANPVQGVRKRPDGRSERFLTPDEMERFGKALEAVKAQNPTAVAILKLLALTGCRKREIEALRWAEVDLAHGFLRLKKTKTGAKNVFLSQTAVAHLKDWPRIVGSEWVFPATSGKGFYQNTPKVWIAVRKKAGLEGVRLHDLRHTFASASLAGGASIEIVAALLGHKERRTTERYAHLASNPIREAADRVAEAIGASLLAPASAA